MSDSPELQLQQKKRARRRLVGAIAVAGLAAVVLPMVMDEEPKQQIQDVQIRIPGQNQTPFKPKLAKPDALATPSSPGPELPAADQPTERKPEARVEPRAEKPAEKAVEKPAEKVVEKAAEKSTPKPAEKSTEKASEKAIEKAIEKAGEKGTDKPAKADESKAAGNGQYLILIGAFANPGNVKQLQTKIGELGIKVITEPLESPDGSKKTRVRAGPFASREAAEKALDKIKRIGVNGVVAARQ